MHPCTIKSVITSQTILWFLCRNSPSLFGCRERQQTGKHEIIRMTPITDPRSYITGWLYVIFSGIAYQAQSVIKKRAKPRIIKMLMIVFMKRNYTHYTQVGVRWLVLLRNIALLHHVAKVGISRATCLFQNTSWVNKKKLFNFSV